MVVAAQVPAPMLSSVPKIGDFVGLPHLFRVYHVGVDDE